MFRRGRVGTFTRYELELNDGTAWSTSVSRREKGQSRGDAYQSRGPTNRGFVVYTTDSSVFRDEIGTAGAKVAVW